MLKDNYNFAKETYLPKINKQNDNYETYKLKAKLKLIMISIIFMT